VKDPCETRSVAFAFGLFVLIALALGVNAILVWFGYPAPERGWTALRLTALIVMCAACFGVRR